MTTIAYIANEFPSLPRTLCDAMKSQNCAAAERE